MDNKHHWESVYATRAADAVSWYQAHADRSLELIEATGVPRTAGIIDVGSGASHLIDDLLDRGYTNITALDLSAAALEVARARLGARAAQVHWQVADVTRADLPTQAFDVWHDRAVFHFLTDAAQRQAYVQTVLRAVRPGGHVIVATFAEDGPEACSGLPVQRYAPDTLHAEFGAPFTLVHSERETHATPWGAEQRFIYCYCRTQAGTA